MHSSSSVKYFTKNSFTILSDVNVDKISMPDQTTKSLPAIINTKVKSVYHQHCSVPNEDFSILHNSIGSKLHQTSITVQHNINNSSSPSKNPSYPSTEFFNRVSTKLKRLHLPLIEDSETDTSDEKACKRTMEKPMFITTVKSGTFLEPPPEVAALLGLSKNMTNSLNSTTSSSEKSSSERSMMYSFASRPRVVKAKYQSHTPPRNSRMTSENRRDKRSTDDNLAEVKKDDPEVSTYYGNTMFDRRVARGSNFASTRHNVISTEHILSRQAEARRRAAVRQRAQIRARKLRMETPPPVDGRKHEQVQTEKYLEELAEKPPESSVACQADLASVSSSIVAFADSNVNGEDAETQIYPGDLPEYDDQIHTVVTSIVNKILREAILEINEEIEKFRSSNYLHDEKTLRDGAFAEELTENDIVIITREELTTLIQAAVEYLKNSKELDVSLKDLEKIQSDGLLEITVREIKTIVRDIKFLSEIIRTILRNNVSREEDSSSSTLQMKNSSKEVQSTDHLQTEEVTSISRLETSEEKSIETQKTEAVMTKKTEVSRKDESADDNNIDSEVSTRSEDSPKAGKKTDTYTPNEFTKDNETEVTMNEDVVDGEKTAEKEHDTVNRPEDESTILNREKFETTEVETSNIASSPGSRTEVDETTLNVEKQILSQPDEEVESKPEENESGNKSPQTQVTLSDLDDAKVDESDEVAQAEELSDNNSHLESTENTEALLDNQGGSKASQEDRSSSSSQNKREMVRQKREIVEDGEELVANTEQSNSEQTDSLTAEEGTTSQDDQSTSLKCENQMENKKQTDQNSEIRGPPSTAESKNSSPDELEERTEAPVVEGKENDDESLPKKSQLKEISTSSKETTVTREERETKMIEEKITAEEEDTQFQEPDQNPPPTEDSTSTNEESSVEKKESKNDEIVHNESLELENVKKRKLEKSSTETMNREKQRESTTNKTRSLDHEDSPSIKEESVETSSKKESENDKFVRNESLELKNVEKRKLEKSSTEAVNREKQNESTTNQTRSLDSEDSPSIKEESSVETSSKKESKKDQIVHNESLELKKVGKRELKKSSTEIMNREKQREPTTNKAKSLDSAFVRKTADTTTDRQESSLEQNLKQVSIQENDQEELSVGSRESIEPKKHDDPEITAADKSADETISSESTETPIVEKSVDEKTETQLKETTGRSDILETKEPMVETADLQNHSLNDDSTQRDSSVLKIDTVDSREANAQEETSHTETKVIESTSIDSVKSTEKVSHVTTSNDLKEIQTSNSLDEKKSTAVVEETFVLDKTEEMTDQEVPAQSEEIVNDEASTANISDSEKSKEEPTGSAGTSPRAETSQKSTNTDPDDEEDEDSDDMDIEGTRIIEETFTETTKTYKEISIRETTLVEREFIEYTTNDDNPENVTKSGNNSKRSSRESTASDNTKQEVVINIERRSSDRNDSTKASESFTVTKRQNSQGHNGTVLMKET